MYIYDTFPFNATLSSILVIIRFRQLAINTELLILKDEISVANLCTCTHEINIVLTYIYIFTHAYIFYTTISQVSIASMKLEYA